MQLTVYDVFLNKLMKGMDVTNIEIKVALLNNSYVPSKSHSTFAEVAGFEITGTGYTAGGKVLQNVEVNNILGTDSYAMSADDVSWDSSTITARTIILYETVTTDLIGSFVLDNDEISNNGPWTIQWDTDGILKVS